MSELELRKLNFHAINQFRVVEISQLLLEQNKCWALFRVITAIRLHQRTKISYQIGGNKQLPLEQNKFWSLFRVNTVIRLH